MLYIFGEVYPVVSASLSYVLKNIFLRIMFSQKKGHFFLFVIFWVIWFLELQVICNSSKCIW